MLARVQFANVTELQRRGIAHFAKVGGGSIDSLCSAGDSSGDVREAARSEARTRGAPLERVRKVLTGRAGCGRGLGRVPCRGD